jgi:GH18 family chitinase
MTKVGVPSHKITVGISSYGRQFQMADPSCASEKCKFNARPNGEFLATRGSYADTPYYLSNAEIKGIIKNHPGAKVMDHGDSSKILTYKRNWVSYMDDADKEKQKQLYKSLNFGGVIE